MALFALIAGGKVAQTAAETFPVHEDLTWTADISTVSPEPQAGWAAALVAGAWIFTGPTVPAPTLAQQAQAAMWTGLAVTSSGTSSLTGTYACDDSAQAHLQAELIALLHSGNTAFADGSGSIAWPDVSGAVHTFDPAQFMAFALAVGAYVAALFKCINGTLSSLPPATATIA